LSSEVFFLPSDPPGDGLAVRPDLTAGLQALTARAAGDRGGGTWGLKVHLGRRGLPASVDAHWMRTVAGQLAVGRGTFAGDTLSITLEGLDKADTQAALARDKGYAATPDDIPWRVADGPTESQGPELGLTGFSRAEFVRLAGAFADVDGWAVLNPVRPHPHVGLRGALTALGVGLVDRNSKIHLHRAIRPQVDTPLCAGCGSCLAVCLFDAIELKAGRAMIDHKKCTGCGECMTVCHMAGISAEEAEAIPHFQRRVAETAAGLLKTGRAGQAGKVVYLNFLLWMDVHLKGARRKGRGQGERIGILAGTDPVALDQAAWDLISERVGGPLSHWSGFLQEPEPLLARAQELGLGRRAYTLVDVS